MSTPSTSQPVESPVSAWVVSVWVVAIAALSTAHLLPGGICFSDSGGLQLASAAFGITHPPGYAVYTTFGYLVSRLLPIDPAFTVTLLFWLMCLAAFSWIPVFQAQLGGSTWLGGAVALGLLLHTNVRQNFLAPEVYGPTLFVLVAGTFSWARFLQTRSLKAACVAATLFGIAWASRPPTVLMLPFVLLSYVLARRRFIPATLDGWKRAALVTALAIAPMLYSFAYILSRDTPTTAYNYLAQYDWEHDNLPDRESGLTARVQRACWLASAAQYRENVRITFWGTISKLRWVRNRLCPGQPAVVGLILMIALVGVLTARRRDRALTMLVFGLGFSSLAFVCLYRVYDLAADLLPLIFAIGTFAALGLSTVLARASPRTRWGLALTAFLLVAVATIVRGVLDRGTVTAADARAFLADADIDTLPANAVILTGWYHATPLWYSRLEYANRPDITVVCAGRDRWREMAQRFPDRNLFAVERPEAYEPFEAASRGSLWNWRRHPDP